MIYTIAAGGTKDETQRSVSRQCDINTSSEVPALRAFLLAALDAVSGDDKRVFVEATGCRSGGFVKHDLTIKTFVVPLATED